MYVALSTGYDSRNIGGSLPRAQKKGVFVTAGTTRRLQNGS